MFGVDPGASGAVALIGDNGFADGRVVDTKEPAELDEAVRGLLLSAQAAYGGGNPAILVERVYIEDVHSRPGEGHVGVFSFGQAKGTPRGWFSARFDDSTVIELISPAKWQADFFGKRLVSVGKDERKAFILTEARKRWPEASLSRVKDEAVAAALYIAECGRKSKPW